MGYRSEYIADLDWEVKKLREICAKFKAHARCLKKENEQLNEKLALFNEIGTEAQNTIRRIDASINADNYREGLSDGEVLDFVYDEIFDYNTKIAKG